MNKIKRSGKLLKTTFGILFRERKLLLFPLLASVLALGVAAFFLVPVTFYPTGHAYFSHAHWSALAERAGHWINLEAGHGHHELGMRTGSAQALAGHPVTAMITAVFYFISMFLATFSNVAFYHEIMQALNGCPVSIRRGFRFACTRWRAVLLWSLFAGLVGYLIQTLQERLGFLGRIVTGFLGFVWSVACIFAIPTLVRDSETVNPIKLLQNSAGTLRRTWGELVIGFVGVELLVFGFVFCVVLAVTLLGLIFSGIFTGGHASLVGPGLGFLLVIFFFLAMVALSWVSGLVNAVYRCALYIYATEGVVPGEFDKELLDSAWKVK